MNPRAIISFCWSGSVGKCGHSSQKSAIRDFLAVSVGHYSWSQSFRVWGASSHRGHIGWTTGSWKTHTGMTGHVYTGDKLRNHFRNSFSVSCVVIQNSRIFSPSKNVASIGEPYMPENFCSGQHCGVCAVATTDLLMVQICPQSIFNVYDCMCTHDQSSPASPP